jgi:hypoxanthine phosphoribosyltransferase
MGHMHPAPEVRQVVLQQGIWFGKWAGARMEESTRVVFEVTTGVVSVLGVFGTFYFGVRSGRLAREKRRFTWGDVQNGAQEIARRVKAEFRPDAVYALSARGAVIVHLTMAYIGEDVPIYVGIQEDSGAGRFAHPPQAHDIITTTKWNNYIPVSLLKDKGREHLKLLIVDDLAVSGDSLLMIVQQFLKHGFRRENIKTATLVCTANAIDTHKEPDYYSFAVPDARFYFPWGIAR